MYMNEIDHQLLIGQESHFLSLALVPVLVSKSGEMIAIYI